MIDELWSMAQRSRSLQSFRADIHGIWSDSAAADINNLYLDPHQDADDEMRRALDEQKHSLDQAQEACNAAQEHGIEAVKLSQRVEKLLEEIEKDLKIVYQQIELFNRSANEARAKFATVKELIARANGACGGSGESVDDAYEMMDDASESKPTTTKARDDDEDTTQVDESTQVESPELAKLVLPALLNPGTPPKSANGNIQTQQEIQTKIDAALRSEDEKVKLEGQVAASIRKYVISFQKKFGDHGKVGEIDVETSVAIIEVTTGGGRDKRKQIEEKFKNANINPSNKPVILYAPAIKEGSQQEANIRQTGAYLVRSEQELIELLQKLGEK